MGMKRGNKIELARIIRAAIEADGRSLYAIAKAADVPYQGLHPFARGHRDDIALATADRLCKVLSLELKPARRRKSKA